MWNERAREAAGEPLASPSALDAAVHFPVNVGRCAGVGGGDGSAGTGTLTVVPPGAKGPPVPTFTEAPCGLRVPPILRVAPGTPALADAAAPEPCKWVDAETVGREGAGRE